MRRYMLFQWDCYYPDGGMEDFIDSFDSLEKANEVIDKIFSEIEGSKHEAHIYDIVDCKIVVARKKFEEKV